jgi:hypothetical protein
MQVLWEFAITCKMEPELIWEKVSNKQGPFSIFASKQSIIVMTDVISQSPVITYKLYENNWNVFTALQKLLYDTNLLCKILQ